MRRSHDAILVLNAGSSSIKRSVVAERAGELALDVRAEVLSWQGCSLPSCS